MLDESWSAVDVLLRSKQNYTCCRLPRLFLISARIGFNGVIHKTIVPSLERLAHESAVTGLAEIEIDHFGV